MVFRLRQQADLLSGLELMEAHILLALKGGMRNSESQKMRWIASLGD